MIIGMSRAVHCHARSVSFGAKPLSLGKVSPSLVQFDEQLERFESFETVGLPSFLGLFQRLFCHIGGITPLALLAQRHGRRIEDLHAASPAHPPDASISRDKVGDINVRNVFMTLPLGFDCLVTQTHFFHPIRATSLGVTH